MNRLDRITAILLQLQSARFVKAQEIADRFNISLRTVYRDVRSLEMAGVPVIGEAGKGYSLAEGYRLPPVMFSREEATAFLTAEKLISQLPDKGIRNEFKTAMFKVKAVLKNHDKDYLEHLDKHIRVLKSRHGAGFETNQNPLQDILKSIHEKRCLQIEYFTNHSQEKNIRIIEPTGLIFLNGYSHLTAFCRLRKDYRTFRTDRIQEHFMLSEKFETIHPNQDMWIERMKKESAELKEVILEIKNSALPFLGDQKYYHGFISETKKKNTTEMKFLTGSLEGMARWYLMFGDQAKILQPHLLKTKATKLLKETLSNLKKESLTKTIS